MNTLVKEIGSIEQALLKMKVNSGSRADSALLRRLWIDYSGVHETRDYRIEVAPKNGNYSGLIVMPIAYSGSIGSVASFSSGIGLDITNQCIIHFRRIYDSSYPDASSSIMVYSNAELFIKNESYTT